MGTIAKALAGRGVSADEERRALGAWIKERRQAAGLTQAELARAVGMAYYTGISAIEVGRNVPSPETYLDMARALQVDPREFGDRVLRHTNPWLHALLFAQNVRASFSRLNAKHSSRLVSNDVE